MKNIVRSNLSRIIGMLYLATGIFFVERIPKFVPMYREFGIDGGLPKLTIFIVSSNPFLWLTIGCIPGISLILSGRKELNKWSVIIGLTITLIFLSLITILVLSLPYVNRPLVDSLGCEGLLTSRITNY